MKHRHRQISRLTTNTLEKCCHRKRRASAVFLVQSKSKAKLEKSQYIPYCMLYIYRVQLKHIERDKRQLTVCSLLKQESFCRAIEKRNQPLSGQTQRHKRLLAPRSLSRLMKSLSIQAAAEPKTSRWRPAEPATGTISPTEQHENKIPKSYSD